MKPGQKVLVIGAAGGVGSFAVQIAKAYGARVTGVCSTSQLDLVRSIGVDDVIDYTQDDFARTGRPWDVIVETAGAPAFSDLRDGADAEGNPCDRRWRGGGRDVTPFVGTTYQLSEVPAAILDLEQRRTRGSRS